MLHASQSFHLKQWAKQRNIFGKAKTATQSLIYWLACSKRWQGYGISQSKHLCRILPPPAPGIAGVRRHVRRPLRQRHRGFLDCLEEVLLRLPLPRQRPVTLQADRTGARASWWRNERWYWSSALIAALAPSLAGWFLWGWVTDSSSPLDRRLR